MGVSRLQRQKQTPSSSSSSSFDKILAWALTITTVIYGLLSVIAYHMVPTPALDTLLISPTTSIRRLQTQTLSLERNCSLNFDSVQQLQHHSFPLHVTPDTVQRILHPGYRLLTNQSRWPSDLPTHVTVPLFFHTAYANVYGNCIEDLSRDFLSPHQLLTTETSALLGSTITDKAENIQLPTIFVSVASYRDKDCSNTVANLYQQAAYPERIRVAIIDQVATNDASTVKCGVTSDKVCGENSRNSSILCRYRHLMDRLELDARHATGPVWARHLAHRYYRGESFALQIDAHVRFLLHWDVTLLDQWRSINNEYAVLTTYVPPDTTMNDTTQFTSLMCESDFTEKGLPTVHLQHGQQPAIPVSTTRSPMLQPYWAAGFSFARGHFVMQVFYDEHLPMVFQGEESSITLRGFTSGYDFYSPSRNVCFHKYKHVSLLSDKSHDFLENEHIYPDDVYVAALQRLNRIVGLDGKGGVSSSDDDPYGLGTVRSVLTFMNVFGIHSEKQQVETHLCCFVEHNMTELFGPALRANRMGLDYSKIDYFRYNKDMGLALRRKRNKTLPHPASGGKVSVVHLSSSTPIL